MFKYFIKIIIFIITISKFKEENKNFQVNSHSNYPTNRDLISNTNIESSELNKIFEINSINLDSIFSVFVEKNCDFNYKNNPLLNKSKNNNENILKIYYYDESKINKCNKFYNKDYIERKKISLNSISPLIYFKRKNNMQIKKLEIKISNSEIAYANLEMIIREFNEKIKSKYAFNFGIPKVTVFKNDKYLI